MKTELLFQLPKNWQQLQPHPLSSLVDFGVGIEVMELAAHMRQHGYDDREPIVLFEGMILDGRHKHVAAMEAGVTPSFAAFRGTDPVAYVTKKAHRQHLTSSQRATFVAKLLKLQASKHISNGTTEKPQSVGGGVSEDTPKNLTQKDAAKVMNVGRKLVNQAVKVEEKGVPEVKEAVSDGTLSVPDAAKVVEAHPRVQRAAVAQVRKGKEKTAKAALFKEQTVDEKAIARAFVRLSTLLDNRKAAYPESPEAAKTMNALAKTQEAWEEWHKATVGKEAPQTFTKPTVEQVAEYVAAHKLGVDPHEFVLFYGSKGWLVGKTPMLDWKLAVTGWHVRNKKKRHGGARNGKPSKRFRE